MDPSKENFMAEIDCTHSSTEDFGELHCRTNGMRLEITLFPNLEALVVREAQRRKIDAATLCSSIIAEHFLAQNAASSVSVASPQVTVPLTKQSSPPHEIVDLENVFNVRKKFPEFPTASVEIAQAVVDAALRIPGTTALRWGNGVLFRPNYVHIQYLQKRGPGGIGVSFYGSPEKHHCPELRTGRNPNYSWVVVTSKDILAKILPEIRKAHDLKF
jgi:hypothetical protein